MLEAIERFKQLGMYAVRLFYGEDIGCDDSDIPIADRRVKLLGFPVGCLGEVQIAWIGCVADLLKADLKARPTITDNPPPREVLDTDGYWIWGTEGGVRRILETPFHGSWKH